MIFILECYYYFNYSVPSENFKTSCWVLVFSGTCNSLSLRKLEDGKLLLKYTQDKNHIGTTIKNEIAQDYSKEEVWNIEKILLLFYDTPNY